MPFFPLALDTFPLLVSATSRQRLQWNIGPMYTMLLSSKYVRISEQGVQWCTLCKAPAVAMSQFPSLQFLTQMGKWQKSFVCVPTQEALCASDSNDTENLITMFPTKTVYVALEKHFFDEVKYACNAQTANRNIATVHKDYQVSLCDIIHGQLEFLLDIEKAVVHWRRNDKPLWWSLLLTLSCLFFFTRVCEHLTLLVHGKRRKFSWFTTAMIISLLVMSRVLQAIGVLTQHLVTEEELTLNLILEFYCYVYVFAELFTCAKCPQRSDDYSMIEKQPNEAEKEQRTDISTLGTLVAVQLILTAQLQNTYENPFLGILTLLFGTRAFLKFMNFTLNHTVYSKDVANDWIIVSKLFFLIVDTGTLTCIFELAVRITTRTEMEYASTATGMLCIIVLGGTFLHTVIQSYHT